MNYFHYQTRIQEKNKETMDVGLQSQAYRRSGAPKPGLRRGSLKLALVLLGMLGIWELLVR